MRGMNEAVGEYNHSWAAVAQCISGYPSHLTSQPVKKTQAGATVSSLHTRAAYHCMLSISCPTTTTTTLTTQRGGWGENSGTSSILMFLFKWHNGSWYCDFDCYVRSPSSSIDVLIDEIFSVHLLVKCLH